MVEFKMRSYDVKRRAESLLKSAARSKTAGDALSRNFEQESRLQNLVNMSRASEQYGHQKSGLGSVSVLWLDVEDARALEFFK